MRQAGTTRWILGRNLGSVGSSQHGIRKEPERDPGDTSVTSEIGLGFGKQFFGGIDDA